MCAASVILDYGGRMPQDDWNNQSFRDFKELVRKAEAFDREHDQPDCEDPAKGKWMREVEERLQALEESSK